MQTQFYQRFARCRRHPCNRDNRLASVTYGISKVGEVDRRCPCDSCATGPLASTKVQVSRCPARLHVLLQSVIIAWMQRSVRTCQKRSAVGVASVLPSQVFYCVAWGPVMQTQFYQRFARCRRHPCNRDNRLASVTYGISKVGEVDRRCPCDPCATWPLASTKVQGSHCPARLHVFAAKQKAV